MPKDPETLAHLEWLGYVQPVGLVVSIPALLAAQAHVGRVSPTEHQRFLACLPRNNDDEIIPEIPDLRALCPVRPRLGGKRLTGSHLASLEVALPEYHETLRPTFVVPEFQPKNADRPWLMLVQCLPTATNLRRDKRPTTTPLAGDTAGSLRALAPRDPGAHRPVVQPDAASARLRPARRTERLR